MWPAEGKNKVKVWRRMQTWKHKATSEELCWTSNTQRLKKKRMGSPDSIKNYFLLYPPRSRGKLFVLKAGLQSPTSQWGGGVSRPIRESRGELQGWLKSSITKLSMHTFIYTHLLSGRFRSCRLRPDHPQEGKQALISTLQGPALSPGLSPHYHATHYTHKGTWLLQLPQTTVPNLCLKMLIDLISIKV